MKRKIFAALIFLATIALITVPLILLTLAADTDNFSVSVAVSDSAPSIDYVYAISGSPDAGTTKVITLSFNVSDPNGVVDIVTASSLMNISKAGETNRTSASCVSVANASTTQRINCSITIYYYDSSGTWDICAYVTDGSNSDSDCILADFTMGTTDDVSVIETSLTFSGSPGDNNVAPTENPLTINNTGNQIYSSVNLTAYNLTGGGDTIGAIQFAVNISASGTGAGQTLAHNAPVTVTGSNITKGPSGQEDLYFYLDIPGGITSTTYNSGSNWIIDPKV